MLVANINITCEVDLQGWNGVSGRNKDNIIQHHLHMRGRLQYNLKSGTQSPEKKKKNVNLIQDHLFVCGRLQ